MKIYLKCKFILLLTFLPFSYTFGQLLNESEIRAQLVQARGNKQQAKSLAHYFEINKPNTALTFSFAANVYAVLSIYEKNGFNKIMYHKKAIKLANKAVFLNNNHLEARFIRFAIQSQSPKIIRKSKYLKEDIAFLKQHFNYNEIKSIPFGVVEEMIAFMDESNEFSKLDILKMKAVLYNN